jgi:hypothetical protein
MAKLTRLHLKELVKECLFEILLDASDSGEVMQEDRSSRLVERSRKISSKKKQRSAQPKALHPSLDAMNYGTSQRAEPVIDTSAITSDPIMAAIFEDTAATTLREQAAAERGKPIADGDAATLIASNNDPQDLFGESAQNWAALAFSDSPKK